MGFFKFPAGEIHYKEEKPPANQLLYVPRTLEFNLSDYLMQLLMAADVRNRRGLPTELLLPYLPYSRQDRPTSKEEPFALKVVGQLLNAANFSKVYTFDAHSDVAYACVNNLVNFPISLIVRYFFNVCRQESLSSYTLVIPDQGSYKKLSTMEREFKDVIICLKQRDTATGRLKIREVIGDPVGKDLLIVDDICDGGATFIEIARELSKGSPKSISLFVTHGIFSKGTSPLFESGIGKIFTTDSFPNSGSTISCELLFRQLRSSV